MPTPANADFLLLVSHCAPGQELEAIGKLDDSTRTLVLAEALVKAGHAVSVNACTIRFPVKMAEAMETRILAMHDGEGLVNFAGVVGENAIYKQFVSQERTRLLGFDWFARSKKITASDWVPLHEVLKVILLSTHDMAAKGVGERVSSELINQATSLLQSCSLDQKAPASTASRPRSRM